ncbi:MAG: SLBB domain-containing protein [Chloroherpetonaceae bacterium]|nr:SLBB domain-containing protein [Chloroherpetonaceae bacterium]MDW8438218.1 SLBB domain-containing protein [Chloroherpetonaceae bacterium]
MSRFAFALFAALVCASPSLQGQDLDQLRQLRDQTSASPATGESRSSLLRNYFSSFSQDQNLLDKLSASVQPAPSLQTIPLEDVIDAEKYMLNAGDVIDISIFSLAPITFRTTVSADGNLTIPNVGSVFVSGKTLASAKPELLEKLSKQYKGGAISITLQRPRTFLVTVTGAIRAPGKHVVSAIDRVDKAILVANAPMGDNSNLAPNLQAEKLTADRLALRLYPNYSPLLQPSLRRIQLRRKSGEVIECDLIRFFLAGDNSMNPLLREGDVIAVPNLAVEQVEKVGIYGAVQIPALYEYSPFDSLSTLLRLAQGATPNADLENVQLVRKTASGFETRRINLAEILARKAPDVPLLPNDRIQVPEKSAPKIGNVTIKGEVKFPGYFAIEEGKTTLKDVVKLAGGFTDKALLNGAKIYRKPRPEDPNAKEPIAITDPGFERARIVRGSNLNPEEAQTFDIDYGARRNYVSANFPEIFKAGSEQDILLKDGDIILIPRDEQTVYVFGQVQRPGFVKYVKGWKARDYLNAVGGETSESTGDVKVLKAGSDEWKTPSETEIESGDWIIAPKKVRKTFAQSVSEYAPIISLFTTAVTLGVLIFQATK